MLPAIEDFILRLQKVGPRDSHVAFLHIASSTRQHTSLVQYLYQVTYLQEISYSYVSLSLVSYSGFETSLYSNSTLVLTSTPRLNTISSLPT